MNNLAVRFRLSTKQLSVSKTIPLTELLEPFEGGETPTLIAELVDEKGKVIAGVCPA